MTTDAVLPKTLEVEQRGSVRWLWLNRPRQRNALDEALVAALDEALDEALDDADTAALVLAGRGPSFCAGADLAMLLALVEAGKSPIEFLARLSETLVRLESSPLPVVAALHGHAIAGGLELALVADVVVAASDTQIGDGHIRNGLIPGGGASVRLSRRLTPSIARWLLLSGESLPASELQGAGWLHAVVPEELLYETAAQLAARLAEQAGPAQAQIKPLLARTENEPTDVALRSELDAFVEHWESAPIADALRNFFEARRRQAAADGQGTA